MLRLELTAGEAQVLFSSLAWVRDWMRDRLAADVAEAREEFGPPLTNDEVELYQEQIEILTRVMVKMIRKGVALPGQG